MPKTLTLREANQGFSRHVRAVEAGEEFVITRNGAPVARMVPIAPASNKVKLTPDQVAALARMRELWANPEKPAEGMLPVRFIGPWDRSEFYDRI